MARARKKKAKAPRKRAATKRRKALAQQSSNSWQMGAGILALVMLLGVGAYFVSMNDSARTTVANLVERIEVPESVKNFPDTVRQQLPEMPSMTNSSSDASGARSNESAPSSN